MTPRTNADDEESRQPLLSDNDHDHDPNFGERASNSQTEPATKYGTENWHWLERLVFKTRLRFAISFFMILTSAAVISCLSQGSLPWRNTRWPWTKDPDYYSDPGFCNAISRLEEQPFCFPRPELLKAEDVRLGDDTNANGSTTGLPSAMCGANDRCTISWRSYLFDYIGRDFDRLAGTTVRGATGRRRDSVQVVMSITEGEPFYTRTVKAPSASPSSISSNVTFQSASLWRALRALSLQVEQQGGQAISVDDLLTGFQMQDSRVVIGESGSSVDPTSLEFPVLETTLSDTHRFVQSLAAFYYGLRQPSKRLPISQPIFRHYLNSKQLTYDGTTSSTLSAFNMVTRTSLGSGGSALNNVGRNNFRGDRMQHAHRLQHLHVLNELEGEHELSIALDLDRGLVITALARLVPSSDEQPTQGNRDEHPGRNQGSNSVWDWIRNSVNNMEYDVESRLEKRRIRAVGGTYRYDKQSSGHVRAPGSSIYDWMEVDVQVDGRALWVTRVEYLPTGDVPSQGHQSNASPTSSVSVLKTYNAGGTADFLAGWTCAYNDRALADCYRPRMGDDDSKCFCSNHRLDEVSSYRVGLWPTHTASDYNVYEIPQGAIRSDTNSYMDQAEGGCTALFDRFKSRPVPEMQRLGYHIKLTDPEVSANGTIVKEAELQWLDNGLTLSRIRGAKLRW